MNYLRQISLILSLILSFNCTLFPAIASGTLVRTPDGFTPIEELQPGDRVVSYCQDCNNLIEIDIKELKELGYKKVIEIETDKEKLLVSEEHLFFDPSVRKFIRAKDITCKNKLLTCSISKKSSALSNVPCYCAKRTKKTRNLYEIKLDDPHLFFVSESQILTHNFGGFIALSFSWGVGGLSFEGIKLGILGVGLALYNFFSGRNKIKTHIFFDPSTLSKSDNKQKVQNNKTEELQSSGRAGSNMPNDPDDEDDKKQDFEISENDANHIFKDKPGHLPFDTPANRKLLRDLVSNIENFLTKDIYGSKWYGEILSNGKQLWARVHGKFIKGGGLNKIPKEANPITGLSRLLPPK